MKVALPSPRTNRRAPAPANTAATPARLLTLPLVALLFVGAAAAAPARAQESKPEPRPAETAPAPPVGEAIDEDDVLRIDSNLVSIPALVTETTGRPVPNLKLEDFELRVDGQVKAAGELHRADTPVAVAVLFDNSSSLSKAREFEKQAAVSFLRRIVRPIDLAAVYSVSTTPVLARPLTNSVSALVRTVEHFPEPEGATALFDSVAEAANYLRTRDARRVIVIVSDGNDTISELSFDQALQRALKYDCQIYVVGTGDLESQQLTDTIAKRRLQVFAAQTGGALYVPRGVQDLEAAFEQISNDISQQYVLSYFPTDDAPDGRFRQIDLRVKTRPSLRVRAREGYYPNAAQAQGAAAGQARVRPRTVGTPAGASRLGGAVREEGPQAPSLDPLYATPVDSPRRDASPAREISIRTLPSASSARTAPRNGPQENVDTSESERPAVEVAGPPRSHAASQPVRAAYESTPPKAPASSPPAPSTSVSTTPQAAEPEPQPPAAKPRGATLEVARSGTPEPTPTPAAKASTPPAPAPVKATRPPSVSGGVLNGKALRLPPPSYPAAAKSARAAGKVTVEVEIDEEGRVVRAQAVSGHLMLQGSAINAARQARFSPTLLSGTPVRITGLIVYNFIQP